MKARWTILSLATWVLAISMAVPIEGWAQQGDPQPFPEEARQRLDYAIGKWVSKTQAIDPKGKVVRTSYSEDERRFVIDDRIVEISGMMRESGMVFRAWEYYDVRSGMYTLTSIDREGRLITMRGELGDVFRWTSDSRELPDGSSFQMRFTHVDIEEDSFTAVGEVSRDGGKTWTVFTRQYLTRRSE